MDTVIETLLEVLTSEALIAVYGMIFAYVGKLIIDSLPSQRAKDIVFSVVSAINDSSDPDTTWGNFFESFHDRFHEIYGRDPSAREWKTAEKEYDEKKG